MENERKINGHRVFAINFQGTDKLILEEGLPNRGFPTETFQSAQFLDQGKIHHIPSLILMREGVPIRDVKKVYKNQPIIAVSKNPEVELDAGAEIALEPPVSVDLLAAYFRSTLARHKRQDEREYLERGNIADGIYTDPKIEKLIKNGEIIDCQPRVFKFIHYLAKNEVASWNQIAEFLESEGLKNDKTNIRVLISDARIALDGSRKTKQPSLITSIRSKGVMLKKESSGQNE